MHAVLNDEPLTLKEISMPPAERGTEEVMATMVEGAAVETPLKLRENVPEIVDPRGAEVRTVCISDTISADVVIVWISGEAAAVAHTRCTS